MVSTLDKLALALLVPSLRRGKHVLRCGLVIGSPHYYIEAGLKLHHR